jgi:hypothetical protein
MDHISQRPLDLPKNGHDLSCSEKVVLATLGQAPCDTCQNLNTDINGKMRVERPVKMNIFEVANNHSCRFCAVIGLGLQAFGANIHESAPMVTVLAIPGNPFYVHWDEQITERTSLELFATLGG